MIRTQGEILRSPQGELVMQATCQSACNSCCVSKVCGGSKRSLLLNLSEAQKKGYCEGQQLHVDIAEGELLRLTLLAYMLPCLLFLVFALLASAWGDLATALGGITGLALGVLVSSWRARKNPPQVHFIPLQTETSHDSNC